MRILHLISSGGMYGAEAVILQLCREIAADPGSVGMLGVFAPAGQPPPALYAVAMQAGIETELIPCKGQLDFSVSRKLQALARDARADIIHAHGYKADVYAFLAFRGDHRPARVSTCHTWYDNDLAVRVYGALDRRILRSFDQVVAVSAEVRDRLRGAGVKPNRVALIRNGVFVPDQAPHGAAGEGRLRVGLVGRLAPEKGVDVFLRAVALLAKSLSDVDFVVAGEGPERAALEDLRRDLRLQARISLPGQQGDMSAFYDSLDLLVSASRQEGLPMAMLEGMATGLPVVATAVGEVPQVVQTEVTGLVVPPGDFQALASAMDRLLRDAATRRRFGDAGRLRVIEHFSAERMAADYLAVYRGALQARSSAQAGAVEAGEAR